MIIFNLVGLAFVTLYERRVLGLLGKREGPFVVGVIGLFQSFGDLIKLFGKLFHCYRFVELFFWRIFIFWGIFMYLLVLIFFNLGGSFFMVKLGFIFVFCIYTLLVYIFIFGG